MARIPMGNFGMRQAELVKTRVGAPNSADLQAIQGLAATVQGIAGNQMAQDRKAQDEADRVAAMLAESRAANQKDALNAEASRQIEMGEDPTKVKESWSQKFSQIDDAEFSGVSEKYEGTLGAQSVRQKGVGLMALEAAHDNFKKKQIVGDLDALQGETLTAATRDPVGAIDRYTAVLDVAGDSLSDKQKSDLKQKFTKDAWITNVNQRVMTGDDIALQSLSADLAKDDGEFSALDSTTRLALQGHVNAKLVHNSTMRSAADNALLVGATQNLAAIAENTQKGIMTSPADMAVAVEQANAIKAKNPAAALRFEAAMRNQGLWAELNASTIQGQQQLADTMVAEARTGSGKGPVFDNALMEQAEAAQRQVSANINHFKADPYGYIESKTGKPAPEINLALMASGNPTDRELLANQIKARTAYAQVGQQVAGQSPGLLTIRESESISAAFDKGGEEAQKGIITALSSMTQSDQIVNKTLAEIGKRSPVLAQIVAYERSGSLTETGVKVSDLVLRGSRAVSQNKDMKIAGPDRAVMAEEFERQAGVAMFAGRDQVRGAAMEAAESAYYGIKARSGDYSKDYNKDAAREAIRGVMGNPTKFNGAPVPPVQGMSAAEFNVKAKSSLSEVWADLAKAGAINLPSQSDFVNDSILQILPDGNYRVLHANGGPLYAEFKNSPRGQISLAVGSRISGGKIK